MNRAVVFTCLAVGVVASLSVVYGRLVDTPAAATPVARALAAASSRVVVAPLEVTPPTRPLASPEQARLDARRELYESVDALVQASELEKARQLLDEDQTRYGDDLAPEWRDLEQSYRLIADCLEQPTPQLRVRAEAFVLVSEAVSLRPRILAACKVVDANRPRSR